MLVKFLHEFINPSYIAACSKAKSAQMSTLEKHALKQGLHAVVSDSTQNSSGEGSMPNTTPICELCDLHSVRENAGLSEDQFLPSRPCLIL